MTLAETNPLHSIVGAAEQDGRWWFVTRDGVYLRADDFLGPLTRVATTRGKGVQFSYRTWRGLLVRIWNEDGAWLGTGDTFAPLAVEGAVLDAAFLDNGVGLVAVAPGTLLRTADMGQTSPPSTWAPRAPGTSTPTRATAAGCSCSPPRGRWPPTAAPPSSPTAATTPRRPPSPTRRGARPPRRAPTPRAHRARDDPHRRPGRVGHRRRLPPRRPLGAAPREVPPPGQRCSLHRVGVEGARQLRHRGRGAKLHVLGDGDRWSSLRVVRAGERLVTSDDGRTLAVAGACEAGRVAHERTPLCVYDGSGWSTLHLSPNASVLSVYGDRVPSTRPCRTRTTRRARW